MTGVVDCGSGNLGSVMNALSRLGEDARFVRGPEELDAGAGRGRFERLIFPGDGHFARAMESLNRSGYADALRAWMRADKPFLGICIGLQLLFDSSEEAPPADGKVCAGLSVVSGAVRRFPGRKVPHIGWNRTVARPRSRLFRGLGAERYFYYIHSYYAEPEDDSATAAVSEYGVEFCSAIERGALCATQFHPEKSGDAGLRLLENFLRTR